MRGAEGRGQGLGQKEVAVLLDVSLVYNDCHTAGTALDSSSWRDWTTSLKQRHHRQLPSLLGNQLMASSSTAGPSGRWTIGTQLMVLAEFAGAYQLEKQT